MTRQRLLLPPICLGAPQSTRVHGDASHKETKESIQSKATQKKVHMGPGPKLVAEGVSVPASKAAQPSSLPTEDPFRCTANSRYVRNQNCIAPLFPPPWLEDPVLAESLPCALAGLGLGEKGGRSFVLALLPRRTSILKRVLHEPISVDQLKVHTSY